MCKKKKIVATNLPIDGVSCVTSKKVPFPLGTEMDFIRGVAFGVAISITSVLTRRLCPESSFDSSHAPFQPPRWVFGVVWPLLFVTSGISWVLADHTPASDALYATLTFLCCLWLPLYTCLRYYRAATAVLASSVAVAVVTLLLATNDWARLIDNKPKPIRSYFQCSLSCLKWC